MAGIEAQIGYRRRYGTDGGKPSIAVNNTLDRQFDVTVPNTAWVTGVTYIRDIEGFAYLAFVIDLYSWRVVVRSMQVARPPILSCKLCLCRFGAGSPKRKS